MKTKEEHKQRISLILLMSICVFVVICIAVGLAALTIHILIKPDVIAAGEDVRPGSLLSLIVYVSAIIGFMITFLRADFL